MAALRQLAAMPDSAASTCASESAYHVSGEMTGALRLKVGEALVEFECQGMIVLRDQRPVRTAARRARPHAAAIRRLSVYPCRGSECRLERRPPP